MLCDWPEDATNPWPLKPSDATVKVPVPAVAGVKLTTICVSLYDVTVTVSPSENVTCGWLVPNFVLFSGTVHRTPCNVIYTDPSIKDFAIFIND